MSVPLSNRCVGIVSKTMVRNVFLNASVLASFLDDKMDGMAVEWISRNHARKEPIAGTADTPVLPEY